MILVFGTVCLDRIHLIEKMPPPGGYVEIEADGVFLGGEAANTAITLRSWKAPVRLVGNDVGDDPAGQFLLKRLLHHEFILVRTDPEIETPICDVFVTNEGERTMFGKGFRGLEHASFSPLPAPIGESWFTADMNFGPSARAVALQARKNGFKLYLMDFLLPDDPITPDTVWQSSTDSVGKRGNTQRNVQWVEGFVAQKGCLTILSDGPNGLVAGSVDHPVRAYPPFPAPKVLDSTGAGDAFRAGMLYGFHQKWRLPDCLRFASAAGCLACGYLGGTGKMPSVEEIQAHIASYPEVSSRYE